MNFGGIGSVIGHEITHGFVGLGSRYDAYGNAVRWWQNNTRIYYKEKAQCLIDQYGNYTDEQTGLKVSFMHN